MKIIFVIDSLVGNGTENVCVTIANALFLLGYNIEIVVLNLDSCVAKKRLLNKIKIVNLSSGLIKSIISLPKYLCKSKPNIVISFCSILIPPLMVSKYLFLNNYILISRCNNTLSVKNINILKDKKDKLLYIKEWIVVKTIELFYKYSDFVIAQCNKMKNDLIENYGISPEKCATIYNPIRESFIFKLAKETIIKDNYILCVGKLLPQKAFDVAIRCFSKISSKYPNLKLIIAGKGELENYLKMVANDYKVSDKIDFIGYIDNVQNLYEKAKFTLLTSKYEGFPNFLIESIAMGTPVVAFDCPSGPSEIIVEGINGFLVKNRDENALVIAMDKALTFNWDIEAIYLTSLKYSIDNIIPSYVSLINEFERKLKDNEL